jgi:hypothetical protein
MAATRTAAALAALLATTASAATSQARVLDSGSFVILKGGDVVGVEEFQVRRTGADAFTVSATAHYPAERPTHVVTAVVHLSGDSVVSSARFETQHARQATLALVTVAGRRITIRIGLPGRESSREYPGTTEPVLLDDSLFGIHALRPPRTGEPVGLLWARAGRRTGGDVTFHGQAETDVGGRRRTLLHVTVRGGEAVRHLWFDEEGRLQKVEAPDVGLTAVRR